MGRPTKYADRSLYCTPAQRQEVLEAFKEYVDDVPYPLVAEFVGDTDVAIEYGVNKNTMLQWPEMRESMKRLMAKQEAYLIRRGMEREGKNGSMAIFLLKQPEIGYKDRVEQDITTGGEKVQFTNALPRPGRKLEKKRT